MKVYEFMGVNKTMVLGFPGALRPLPKASSDLRRQAISQLTGKHHNLPPVVAFMRHEIAQNVTNVEGKVAPHIR